MTAKKPEKLTREDRDMMMFTKRAFQEGGISGVEALTLLTWTRPSLIDERSYAFIGILADTVGIKFNDALHLVKGEEVTVNLDGHTMTIPAETKGK